jgi:hypothetical protein
MVDIWSTAVEAGLVQESEGAQPNIGPTFTLQSP